MIIKTKSYPRAAVIGNPSDGYFGKTIAFVFSNFCAEVELVESEQLQIIPGIRDKLIYENLKDFENKIKERGYYGGIRLLKATIKKFIEYCENNNIFLPSQNFTISYQSNIPNRLGLAGSSAIITAALKAICQFYNIKISIPVFANLVLAVETEELLISAGLQDRVAQAYERPVFMDFDEKIMKRQSYGNYETFPTDLFPNFYIAFQQDLAEGSEVVHNNLRERYDNGDLVVRDAMNQFSTLTTSAFRALKNKEPEKLSKLMDQNFDLRKSICEISTDKMKMIDLARSCGASAKFTGSGGAIIGVYENEDIYSTLQRQLTSFGIQIIKPKIVG